MNIRNDVTRRFMLKTAALAGVVFVTGSTFTKKLFGVILLRRERMEGVYRHDKIMNLRKSQDNPEVKQIYKDFLKHPNSHEAHHLLHTEYIDRSLKIKKLKARGIKI